MHFQRRTFFWAGGVTIALSLWGLAQAGPAETPLFSIIGAQSWGPWTLLSETKRWGHGFSAHAEPRISVLETDAWQHSLVDDKLRPVSQLPLPNRPSRDLMRGARFTAAAYLAQIESMKNASYRQKDILMYYGGIRRRPNPEGLNFNGWSGEDLRKLRSLGCRPFIGLETTDKAAVKSLVWRLKEAGYDSLDRIYIRITSEPSYSAYGTEDGTSSGKRRTAAAYAAYQKRFVATAQLLNSLNRKLGLNIHTVFAGANGEDFNKYMPAPHLFDAIGFDLYVTPENKAGTFKLLESLSRRYPYKPLVIPEFGIATERRGRAWFRTKTRWSDPEWAAGALGDVLAILGKHPAGIEQITVFSVNVTGRMENRRWSWAWTPRMYEMLREWQSAPRRWNKEGFHRYDPQSYPVGRDVLFMNRKDLKIVYRKLAVSKATGIPLFQETCLFNRGGKPVRQVKIVTFEGREKREYRPPLFAQPIY
jgi:hypothetical protein